MKYKYTLIVSQFYHSYHTFVVHHKEDFLEKAREFAKELIDYKRNENDKKRLGGYLGDLDPKYTQDNKIKRRYNINDMGDIYFLQADSVKDLINIAEEFVEKEKVHSIGYVRKEVLHKISEHHNVSEIEKIVNKYFEVA